MYVSLQRVEVSIMCVSESIPRHGGSSIDVLKTVRRTQRSAHNAPHAPAIRPRVHTSLRTKPSADGSGALVRPLDQ